ncbi:DUF3558 domain-containing protein [Nocardia sp. CNY236]|uniref:DUF3558 domain-containing protein n=1 Tax=Nocardia sp. CNY236 TaxID=1169152 RepID=UPI00040DB062|nr:DUF3558 domain-containing protein [Nocardia sp. CNY236]
MKRVAAIVAAGLAVAGLTACGDSTSGTAQPTTRNIDEIIVYNVCRDPGIADDVLVGAGLDPATKSVFTDAPTGVSSFRVCSWDPLDDRYGPPNYRVGVWSTSHTLEEERNKESVTILRETTVNGRRGHYSQERGDPGCWLSFEAEQGMFMLDTRQTLRYGPDIDDPCEIITRYAESLEPHLPK